MISEVTENQRKKKKGNEEKKEVVANRGREKRI